jgi:hypothetical protein
MSDFLVPDPKQDKYNLLGKIYMREDLGMIPKPKPLIDGWLDRGTTVMLIGATQIGKSFTMIGWACSVATGVSWLGHDVMVEACPVLYVVGEGSSGLDDRITAWETEHQQKAWDVRIVVLPESLSNAEVWSQVTELAKEIEAGLVLFDTLSSLYPEINESQDAAKVVRAMVDLQVATGATVVTAHHTGWANKGRARGGSQLEANPDAVITLESDGDPEENLPVRIKRKKAKDAPSGKEVWVQRKFLGNGCVLELCQVPVDAAEIKDVTRRATARAHITAALRSAEAFTLTAAQVRKKAGGNAKFTKDVLDEMIRDAEIQTREVDFRDARGFARKRDVLGHVTSKQWHFGDPKE